MPKQEQSIRKKERFTAIADENREAKRKALCSLTVTWYGNTVKPETPWNRKHRETGNTVEPETPWNRKHRGTGLKMKERFWPCENWNKSSLTRPIFRAVFVSRSIFHAAKIENPVPCSETAQKRLFRRLVKPASTWWVHGFTGGLQPLKSKKTLV